MFNRQRLPFLHQLLGEFPAVTILGWRLFFARGRRDSFPLAHGVRAVTLGELQGALVEPGLLPESDCAALRIERLTKTVAVGEVPESKVGVHRNQSSVYGANE